MNHMSDATDMKEHGWLTDLETAKQQAADAKKPILALFSGSDWCPHCQALKRNVFDQAEFKQLAKQSLILLDIDMPKQGLSEEKLAANRKIMQHYGIEYFPTVYLLDADGKVAGEVTARDRESFLAELQQQVD